MKMLLMEHPVISSSSKNLTKLSLVFNGIEVRLH